MNALCLAKRIISFVLVFLILTVSVFAEDTRNISYKVNVDEDKNISVVETSLDGDIDNSNLNVKVIKKKGDIETVVYTGTLGNYSDGLWKYTDFSEIQFLVVFDWNGPSDEALYIIPLGEETSQITTEENVVIQSDEDASSSQTSTDIVPVDVTSYDETYSIKQAIIKNSDDVIVYDCETNGKLESVTLVKHTSDTIPAKMFVALYNGGIMENMQMVDVVGTGSENSEIICNVNMTLGTITDNHYIKIMVWDGFNSMRPLVDAYNTSIIATDYVYNNTIQTAGQIDSYSFSVKQDGYYSITIPTGSNINGELYHSSSMQTPIATANDMSASNKITQYLLKDEVYTVKFTSQTVGAYGFSIIEDSVENSLVLNTSKSGLVSYPKDRLVYEFTPTETAMYFFESTSNVHPYIILFDSSDNMLEVADNLEYENTVVLGYELEANQTYYLRIGSQSRLVGNISTYVKKVKVSISGTTVNISGNLDTVSGNRVALGIYDSVGSLKRISQVNTSSNGSFTYSTVLDTSNQSYQCIINQNSKTVPVRFEFGNGVISKIIDDYELATVTGSATVTPTFSASRISANANMSVDISIKNNDNNTQDILLYWVLCDTNGIIVKACGTGSEFVSGQTEVLHMEMNMPASVSGLTLKLFTWQGKNIDHSTFRPLAKVYSISTSGTSSLSIEDNELSIGEIEATSEVELITDENVDATLDYTEIKATSGLLNTATPFAINELDLIDMNFQVRCNDKNTGGELQLGKNIITIYYKNKTNSYQTFDPLVLWGYYDENDELQQTYFHWHESITLAPKGDSNYEDIRVIDYEVEVPSGVDFAAGYWAINEDYDYVCTKPTALRYNGLYQGQPAPLFFEEKGEGKFIYCNNREGIKRTDLADSNNPNPRLLMHEKGLFDGKYEMLLFHNNDTTLGIDPTTGSLINYNDRFPIYLDVQYYDPYGTATVEVTNVGFQIPKGGESWACIQGYSDYKQIPIYDLNLSNEVTPNQILAEPYVHSFGNKNTLWISDVMPNDYYTSVQVGSCVYMVIEFSIYNSQGIEINVAAFEDNGDFNNRFSDYQAGTNPDITAPFIKDMQYKGIANTLPQVEAKAILAFDDNVSSGSRLPVTVFNPIEPGGNIAYWWKTNINPQSEKYYANLSDASNMLHFTYNDPQKLNAYGSAFSGEKDTVWRFDVEHSDTYQFPANRSADNDPNYLLPRPYLVNSNGESSNLYEGQNLANYGVVNRYNYEIYNHSSSARTININLDTGANNVIILRNPDYPDTVFYAMYKGESSPSANDVVFDATMDGYGNGIGIWVDIILTTGNAGGMANSITVAD